MWLASQKRWGTAVPDTTLPSFVYAGGKVKKKKCSVINGNHSWKCLFLWPYHSNFKSKIFTYVKPYKGRVTYAITNQIIRYFSKIYIAQKQIVGWSFFRGTLGRNEARKIKILQYFSSKKENSQMLVGH